MHSNRPEVDDKGSHRDEGNRSSGDDDHRDPGFLSKPPPEQPPHEVRSLSRTEPSICVERDGAIEEHELQIGVSLTDDLYPTVAVGAPVVVTRLSGGDRFGACFVYLEPCCVVRTHDRDKFSVDLNSLYGPVGVYVRHADVSSGVAVGEVARRRIDRNIGYLVEPEGEVVGRQRCPEARRLAGCVVDGVAAVESKARRHDSEKERE